MKFLTILKVALRALTRNKLRSALTLLGMVFGVGAVIAMVSLGQGAQQMVQDQIKSIGTNLLFIRPGSRNTRGAQTGAGNTPTLTAEDIDAIAQEIPVVLAASPMVNSRAQIIFGSQNWQTQVIGTNENAPRIRDWSLAEGEFFNDGDVRSASRVIVLGKTVADNLFQGIDPVGQAVRVRNLPFRVIGVLAPKGQSAMGQDQDDLAVVPYTTAQKKLRHFALTWIDNAMVLTGSQLASRVAETQITALLRQRHNLRADEPNDFEVRNLTDVAQAAESVTTILTLFLGSIAAVSLLVGGIGIMNIMLVSVTERTREIGIRMAVGARSSQIRMQFLTESVLLSLTGGVIGIVFGAGLAVAISRVMGWPVLVSSLAIIVSFAFAAGVGVFFGYYPAHRAASLDPIEALRYE